MRLNIQLLFLVSVFLFKLFIFTADYFLLPVTSLYGNYINFRLLTKEHLSLTLGCVLNSFNAV